MQTDYDIAIAGGGLAGASLACALSHSGFRVVVLEQFELQSAKQPSYDDRGLALSLASCRILEALGLWPMLEADAVPIRHIHVSERGRFGAVRINAEEMHIDAMGYVVTARTLGVALLEQVNRLADTSYLCPVKVTGVEQGNDRIELGLEGAAAGSERISTRLLVAADGADSYIRGAFGIDTEERDYRQTAIVANIDVDQATPWTAYERFTPDGPLALLPMQDNRYVSVNCVSSDRLQGYMDMDESAYIASLQAVLGRRPGTIVKTGKRRCYPLSLIQARQQTSGRCVLLGNSAHAIHPNGAQGFNLGLRDVAGLADVLMSLPLSGERDPGSHTVLQDYLSLRQQDQRRVIGFSDGLARWFSADDAALKGIVTSSALLALDAFPLLKGYFARFAMGIAGRQPAMVRGLPPGEL